MSEWPVRKQLHTGTAHLSSLSEPRVCIGLSMCLWGCTGTCCIPRAYIMGSTLAQATQLVMPSPAQPSPIPPIPCSTDLPLLLKQSICPGIGAAAAGMLCPSSKLVPTQLLCPASTHTSITLPAGSVEQTVLSKRAAKKVPSQQIYIC